MKKFTPILTIGMLATAMAAGAQATFEKSETDFWTTHRTAAFMGDFTGNDHLDIFYGGQGNERFNTPGWWWQMQQNFCKNNGDGTFTIDGLDYFERDNVDENGNPVLDENQNPTKAYDRVWSQHGIICATFNQYAAIDYNNDGKLDLLVFGTTGEWDIFLNEEEKNLKFLRLYKNIGEGKFELVTDAAFPSMQPDNNSKNYSLAVGDYDNDGYVDFIVAATEYEHEDNYPGRTLSLYRNMGGTGVFQDMKIAETKGGVYTKEVKDGETVIVEKKLLDGYFLPMSGNVHFADLNNDGWLDIVADGWADDNWDGIHQNGNTMKIYLNQEGKKFIDATPEVPSFVSLRSSASNIADFDKDGYLDYFSTGWGDNGYNWNAFLYYNTNTATAIFDEPITCDNLGLDGTEGCRQIVRDFDGDGFADIYYSGASGCQIYYGNLTGSFTKGEGMPSYSDGYAATGDINGNGLSDIFMVGYGDNGAMAQLMLNTGLAVEAPAMPENVKASIADGVLTITWDYDTDAAASDALAYNVAVKGEDGSIYTLVPANMETGFVKVGYGRTVALRPNIKTFSMPVTGEKYTVGVQAISTINETYSKFATADTDGNNGNNGVESVADAKADFEIVVSGDALTVKGEGTVEVYNTVGSKVATGVAGSTINLSGNGVFVVTMNGQSKKIVK